MVKEVTCTAPVNIAVIKYWGKRDPKLILPINSSLSVTLDQSDLRSTTTARLLDQHHSEFRDQLYLNGVQEAIEQDSRLGRCLKRMRELKRAAEQHQEELGTKQIDADACTPELPESCRAVLIASENNFPTAAGLASSASGFAALAFSLYKLYDLKFDISQLSMISRQGSGSACRSMYGGFVSWEMGEKPDGSDSLASQVSPRSHWPDLEALICVVNQNKKSVSSTSGMDNSVRTSALLDHRARRVVPERMERMKDAIAKKDFDAFASLTMADSNQFHSICLDTSPPIFYLNDVSRSIIGLVEELNRSSISEGGGYLAAYTFDAGPNAVIFAPKERMKVIIQLILQSFPLLDSSNFADPRNRLGAPPAADSVLSLPGSFNRNVCPTWPPGSLSRLIHTTVGDGPCLLSNRLNAGLLDLLGRPQSLPR